MSESFIWSWSTSRIFQKCQRQWYYKTFVASHNAKDDRRREAYLLSKLQSVSAWRGSLVDDVIEKQIVPALRDHRSIDPSELLGYAWNLFNLQWEFAMQHRLRQPGFSVSGSGDSFAAFYAVEYGLEIKPEEREQAWSEVEKALRNLLEMDELLAKLRSATYLFAQHPLIFPLFDVNIRSVPDLIGFYHNEPPLIIDWKVSIFGTNDYRSQLGTYALALSRNNGRMEFPASASIYKPTDFGLFEVQLLTGQLREYSITETDIEEIESNIFHSAMQMFLAQSENADGQMRPFDFPVTGNPNHCQRCNFKSLCWKERNLWVDWKQMSLL